MTELMSKKQFRFTGFHMLACMVAFFGVIIAVNLTMARFATSSWTGLVVKNSYVASQKFNSELARAEAQAKLGWISTVTYRSGKLSFALHDKSGEPLSVQSVSVVLGRPAYEQQDRKLTLVEATTGAAGSYGASTDLQDGTWMLTIMAAVQNGETYRRDLRFTVNNNTGKIQ